MSVDTDADRYHDSAREHIRDAIRDLGEIVVNQCDGYREWDLTEVLADLIKIRHDLGGF